MSQPVLTQDYVTQLRANIAQGQKPEKAPEVLSRKAFIKEMFPEIFVFLAEGYDYKSIAAFLGPVSAEEVKKVVEKCAKEQKKNPNTTSAKTANTVADEEKTTGKNTPAPKQGKPHPAPKAKSKK